jgi:hypothetical protein
VLDLLGTTVGILCQHRLGAFLSKVLACLPERLGHACHRLGHVLLAHVHPRRDLLRSLFRHRRTLASGCAATLTGTGKPTRRLLDLVDNLTRHVVGTISHRRR